MEANTAASKDGGPLGGRVAQPLNPIAIRVVMNLGLS
jgi:hypothetical protein